MTQIKIPVDSEKNIEITDPIYTFNEVMEQIDLTKYYHESKIQSKKHAMRTFYISGSLFSQYHRLCIFLLYRKKQIKYISFNHQVDNFNIRFTNAITCKIVNQNKALTCAKCKMWSQEYAIAHLFQCPILHFGEHLAF